MKTRTDEPLVRDAADQDWPSIWPIFREITAARDTYVYDPGMSEPQARAMWLETLPGRTTVATDVNGRVLGTAKMGPNKGGPGSHVATASFMVDANCRARGIGRQMAEDALAWARGEGYLAMQFNAVVETNERAVELWKSLGFSIIGTVPRAFRHPAHGLVGLHIMHLEF